MSLPPWSASVPRRLLRVVAGPCLVLAACVRPSAGRTAEGGSAGAPPAERRIPEAIPLSAILERADSAARRRALPESLHAYVDRLSRAPTIAPVQGRVTSVFTPTRVHPLLHVARAHVGVDIAAPQYAAIVAAGAGKVARVGFEPGYGYLVVINHGDGVESWYAHCAEILVGVGERVHRGQPIGLVGSTGLSTGPHVHYEVRVNGRPVDPARFASLGGARVAP